MINTLFYIYGYIPKHYEPSVDITCFTHHRYGRVTGTHRHAARHLRALGGPFAGWSSCVWCVVGALVFIVCAVFAFVLISDKILSAGADTSLLVNYLCGTLPCSPSSALYVECFCTKELELCAHSTARYRYRHSLCRLHSLSLSPHLLPHTRGARANHHTALPRPAPHSPRL
jgi:hypothetical protein